MSLIIGIDGGEHTGLAVWDTNAQEFLQIATLPLHRALEEVNRWAYACQMAASPTRLLVVVEDPRQRKWFPKERNNSEYRGRLMGAGAAKRDAKIWEEFLQDKGILYEMHRPQPGTTKWDAKFWEQVIGWTGRTSEHSRDAALLVYGRK